MMINTLRIQKSNRKTMSLSITKEGEILVKAPSFLRDEEMPPLFKNTGDGF
jgi:hypothetical protein